MFEIDKQKFGAFVAELRKEKGYTQKDLAQRLYISDKAVSKWETGVSIPDTALLVPLADLLGVTVTELLMCQCVTQSTPMDAGQVESVVKTAISYSGGDQKRAYQRKSKWMLIYVAALVLACLEIFLNYKGGFMTECLMILGVLGPIFGCYFCFFARSSLPAYYDENRISSYNDGMFRMNVPGLTFNNSNWPHILNVGRVWSLLCMAVYPALNLAMFTLLSEFWRTAELYVMLVITLGGLFVPMYIVGKKYEH